MHPTLLGCILLCAVMAGAAAAEHDPDDTAVAAAIDRAVAAGDAQALAWAAHAADGHASPLVAQALLRALAARAALAEGDGRRCAIDAVLDRLIRGAVPVPGGVLVALVDERPHQEQALILAAADPRAGAPALRHLLANACWQNSWVLACDVLAAAKDPSLAALLLARLTIHLELQVTEPGVWSGACSMGGGSGCGRLTVPADFPSDPCYSLSLEPRAGDIVVATGPQLVTMRRAEYLPGTHGIGSSQQVLDRDALAAIYLALLLDSHGPPPQLTTSDRVGISWSDARAYAIAAGEARARAERQWRAMADALVAAGMLSGQERSALAPRVEVTVYDHRSDKATALPEVPGQLIPACEGGAQGASRAP